MPSVSDIKDVVQVAVVAVALVTPATVALWNQRIDARTKPDREKVALLEDKVRILEFWVDQAKPSVNAIPRTLAILERLEPAISNLSNVCGELAQRVARVEGPVK